MKLFGQTKDGAVDNLLRAYVSRPSNPHKVCPDFDPDRANAYIERSLLGASRSQYETHLSECTACRKNVVALTRLAEADTLTSVVPARDSSRSTWLSGVKQMFGVMSQPRWAMAAAAVIVLAISLPVLLSRNESRKASQEIVESDGAQSAAAPASPANPTPGDAAPQLAATSKQRDKSADKNEILTRNATAAAKTTEASAGVGAGADLSKKSEATDSVQPADEQRKSEGKLAQAPAQGGAAPGSQVAKNDSDQGRQQQPEKDSKQVTESQTVIRADEPSADKEKAKKAEEAAAPPGPASSSDVARSRAGGGRQPGKLALRDSASGESVRADERKFSGKKFSFRDGAWTDKDFDPNKDLPVVTIIRDSNVYKELLTKRPGLKPFLTGFPAAERAIIVYKGTVYKLIPQ